MHENKNTEKNTAEQEVETQRRRELIQLSSNDLQDLLPVNARVNAVQEAYFQILDIVKAHQGSEVRKTMVHQTLITLRLI